MVKRQAFDTKIHPVEQLHGVGKQVAKHLERLSIHTIEEVLLHLPLRYQDRTQIYRINQLRIEMEVVLEGEIVAVSRPLRGRTKLLVVLSDGSGTVNLRFFHAAPFQLKQLQTGRRLRCFGQVRQGLKSWELFHPEYRIITPTEAVEKEQALTPFYPSTEGLTQPMWRKITTQALALMQTQGIFREWLPVEIRDRFGLQNIQSALTFIHRPPQEAKIPHLLAMQTQSHQRLIIEELLAHRLSLIAVKNDLQKKIAFPLARFVRLEQALLSRLPFTLTAAQSRVLNEVRADLCQPKPMLRLIQGDVGCGKTVVATLAMLQAVENGYQALLMAPTELLAEQQLQVLLQWFNSLNVKVAFLTSSIKGRARQQTLDEIAAGNAQIILGTHALFQEGVQFKNLALIVVDEQHRFGVEQRALLRQKGIHAEICPHQLMMTATPIPRTLAMSIYADLDYSVIDTLPPQRLPITTRVFANTRRDELIGKIQEAIKEGKQAYWVCPLIEQNEQVNAQAATQLQQKLQEAFVDIAVGLVHGRMSAQEKYKIMHAFKRNEIKLLVATTVIEVGVDVPNATFMIIENAERLGLSQLHQLRGRVGRGSGASYCLLLYQEPLSPIAKQRLEVMRATNDGFEIAQRDLELRGPGEILGTRQTGDINFRVADLIRDQGIIKKVQDLAAVIIENYDHLIEPLVSRWLKRDHYYQEV